VEGEAVVPGSAEDAGGVVLEAAFVERAYEARVQVIDAAVRVEKGARSGPVQGHRHRVDREVAAPQVVVDRRRRHMWQGAGPAVGLGAGGGEVDVPATAPQGCGAECPVGCYGCSELPSERQRQGRRVGFNGQVDIEEGWPRRVSRRATDEVGDDAGLVGEFDERANGRVCVRGKGSEPFIDKFWVFRHVQFLL
jgi:hypothetical protein